MDWSQRYTYHFPTRIRFGKDVIGELGPFLKEQGLIRPLIVTDPALAELPLFGAIVDDLMSAGLQSSVYKGIHKNPVKSDVLGGVEHHRHQRPHRDRLGAEIGK